MKWFWVLLVLLPGVMGATIHGTIYDFSLNTLQNVIVGIDTSPNQQIVAKNGTYSFTVPAGNYTLTARHAKSDSEISEDVLVGNEGDFVVDLILLPFFDEDLLFEDVPEVPIVEDVIEDRPISHWFLWLLVFSLLGYVIYKVSKKPQRVIQKVVKREVVKEVKEVVVVEDLEKILKFIEQEGGRTTQKDVRRQFPYSEAKVSLMLDELVAKGLIKKVKKGRGNLILKA